MADLTTSLIPFLFVLAVTYGSLEFSELFKRRQVNLIIALILAFVAVSNEMVSEFIMSVLPYAIMLFVVFFFIGFVIKIFKKAGTGEKDYTLMLIVLILVAIFLANFGLAFFEDMIPGLDYDTIITVLGLVMFGIVFYAIYKVWGSGPSK